MLCGTRRGQPAVQRRTDLLRFNGAVERDPAIDLWFDQWLSKHPNELGAIAKRWFTVMRQCGDEVRELLHDGCPVACLGDAPFAYVNVGFFHGAALPAPARLLQGRGKFMRHVKLQPAAPASDATTNVATNVTNDAALARLIAAAYSDIKSRVENG